MKIDLKGSTVRPGDKIILTTPDRLTSEQAALIKHRVETELPGVTALIISGGAEVSAIYRPERGTKETR